MSVRILGRKNANLVSKKSFLPSKSTQVECVQLKDKNSEQISQFSSSQQQRTIGHGQSETAKKARPKLTTWTVISINHWNKYIILICQSNIQWHCQLLLPSYVNNFNNNQVCIYYNNYSTASLPVYGCTVSCQLTHRAVIHLFCSARLNYKY